MGRLHDFLGYVVERLQVMSAIEAQLCKLQAKYESYFAEVGRVRESELEQLTAHIVADRKKLPAWLNASLDRAQAQAEADFEEKLLPVRRKLSELRAEAEKLRQRSAKEEDGVHLKNVELDREEEELKARNQRLLEEIESFNRRIRELGHGFGFFANLFRMKELTEKREELDREQADVAARVETLRLRWRDAEGEHASLEDKLRRDWISMQSKAAALQAKLDYLEGARSRLVLRSTVERVLFELRKEPVPAAPDDRACPRCMSPNPASNHFCYICAQRLHKDRTDLEGSIEEIAEVNLHHQRFAEGMKAGQELIGLVRGITSGLEAFARSVENVIDSENTHPLPKLQIDVPERSVAYARCFDQLRDYVKQDLSLHPKQFAEQVQPLVREVLSEAKIKAYFESMGQELSAQASAQWPQ